jgi:hypothetical protein
MEVSFVRFVEMTQKRGRVKMSEFSGLVCPKCRCSDKFDLAIGLGSGNLRVCCNKCGHRIVIEEFTINGIRILFW